MNTVPAAAAPARPAPAGADGLPRLLPPPDVPAGLAAHLGRHGPVPYRGAPRALIPDVRASGLTGRGGAAFPTYRKLEAVAAWFRGLGPLNEPGTMLCTLRQADRSVTVAEAAIGTPLGALLDLRAASAVLVGGYHGAWIPGGQADRLALSNGALRPLGGFTGAGVLAALPAGRCGLAEAAAVARYLALESAGQCGPCLNGLPSIAAAMTELAGPQPAPRVLADLSRWAGLVEGRGACHHPDGTVRFVRSALRVFADEVREHQRGRCNGSDDRPFLPIPDGADR
jgi:NADH:ubiquinone oxidoreductase subunit F (NADH-binding)